MSTATYKNLAGFSAEKIALLEQDFAALDEAGARLAERAVRYMVDGEDADVLEAVAKSKRPAERLRLNHDLRIFQAKAHDGEARLKFFETVEPVGFEPYLRLAKLFEAAAKGGPPVVLPFQAFYGGLPWLEIFLQEMWLLQALAATPGGDERKLAIPLPLVEQMLEAEGQDPAWLIKSVFHPSRQEPVQSMPAHVISRLPGFGESLVKHREIVAAALLAAGSPRKVELLHILSTSGAQPQPFVAELVRLWLGPAKTVREWTSRLLMKVRDEARPHFEQAAASGTPAQRGRDSLARTKCPRGVARVSASAPRGREERQAARSDQRSVGRSQAGVVNATSRNFTARASFAGGRKGSAAVSFRAAGSRGVDRGLQLRGDGREPTARNIANNTRRAIRRPICRSTANRSSSCFAVGWNSPI